MTKVKIEVIFRSEIEYTEEEYMTHSGPMSIEEAILYEKNSILEDPDSFVNVILDDCDSQENLDSYEIKVWSE